MNLHVYLSLPRPVSRRKSGPAVSPDEKAAAARKPLPTSPLCNFKCPLSVLLRFTALIADRAACLARGLAGRLAFAASAFFDCILKILRVQSLNMLHLYILLYQRVQLNKRR